MKKYILLLILILCLAFTLTIYSADLFGTYDQRIKLTVHAADIDADVTWFPVTVFLTSTAGEEVFAEFDADADYIKVAFTTSDESTQLYAEMELFDDSEQKAIYHVSKTGWVLDDTVNTDFYMYYDNDAADNTDYIGAIDTTAGGNVWDSNFKAVYHMVDATTSTIKDSTSNNNDGTKKAANEPIEATGRVGQGQDFDGSDDLIDFSSDFLETGVGFYEFTVEAWVNPDSVSDETIVFQEVGTREGDFIFFIYGEKLRLYVWKVGPTEIYFAISSTLSVSTGSHQYVAVVNASPNNIFQINGSEESIASSNGNANFTDGIQIGSPQYLYDGILDEVRISATGRSTAWRKATYNTTNDSLLTYGSEEEAPPVTANAIMFGMAF